LIKLWLNGPAFLLAAREDVKPPAPVVRMNVCGVVESDDGILKLYDMSHDLYALKKRLAYLVAFIEFVIAKVRKSSFKKPVLDVAFLDRAFLRVIRYVQVQCFGPTLKC